MERKIPPVETAKIIRLNNNQQAFVDANGKILLVVEGGMETLTERELLEKLGFDPKTTMLLFNVPMDDRPIARGYTGKRIIRISILAEESGVRYRQVR